METDADQRVAVTVSLPGELLREMDRFAVKEGYEHPSAVVSAALETASSE